MRHLLTLLLALYAAPAFSVNSGTAPPPASDCEPGDDQDAVYIQRSEPPKLCLCNASGWACTTIADETSSAQAATCNGTDKLRAFDAATGAFTCAADQVGGDPCSAWPVGSVFVAVVATNPETLIGCGTWSAFGAGRVLIGYDSGQTEFDALEEIGGAKSATLTEAQIPTHSHGITDPGHAHITQRYPTATGGSSGYTIDTSMSGTPADNTLNTKSTATGVTVSATGGGQAHNILNPYIVVRLWRRES